MPRSLLLVPALLSAIGCGADPRPAPRGPEVYVSFRADNPAATLERSVRADRWDPVCTSPCARTLSADPVYRVSGKGLTHSSPFVVAGPTTIVARTGSNSAYTAGSVMLALGIPVMVLGGLVTLGGMLGGGGHGVDTQTPVTIGAVGFLGGTALTVGGALLMRANDTTVDLRERGPIAKVTLSF